MQTVGARRAMWVGMMLTAHGAALKSQETGTIVGHVRNAATGGPVPAGGVVHVQGTPLGAHVAIGGTFTIANVPPGDQVVFATAIGYAPDSVHALVASGATTDVELSLQPVASALNQVVVTASKAPTPVRDVPAPVEVVPQQIIQQSGAQTFMQAMQTTTGVTAAQFGENFQSIQLRGLPRLGNENETVLILIDGVPQTDARNSAQINDIPLSMIEQIEVVRGPSSALYGRTAIGGTINILTPQPAPKHEFSADLMAGDLGYVRGIASASGPVGTRSGYVLAWQGERHDGFQFPALERQFSSLFGKFVSDVDTKTRVMVTTNYVTNPGGTPAPIPIESGRLLSNVDPAFPYYRNLNLPYAQYNQQDLRTTARLTRQLSDALVVNLTTAYRHSRYDFVNDGDVLSPPPAPDSLNALLFPFTSHREEDAYFDDLQFESRVGPSAAHHRVIAGISFERNTGSRGSILPYGPTTADSIQDGVYVNYRQPQYPGVYDLRGVDIGGSSYYSTFYSAYVQDEITLFDRVVVSLGGRFDLNEISSRPIGPTINPSVNGTFRKFTPKAGISYRLLNGVAADDPQVSIYSQYSQGFLPPASSLDPQTVRITPPTPETITNYEGGIKGSLYGGLLGFDASAFYLTRNGIALEVRTGGNTFATTSSGVEDFPGVEIGLNSRVSSVFSPFVKYAYYGAHFGTYHFVSNGTDFDFTQHRIALAPKDVYDVGTVVSASHGVGLYLAGHFEGSRYLDYSNTFLLPSYFVTNGRVSWTISRYQLAFAVSNIFNQRYLTDGDLSTAQFAFPGAARRVTLELSKTF